MDYNWLCDCEKFHRRDFLRVGVLSLLGLSLSKYFALADGVKKVPNFDREMLGDPERMRRVVS